MQRYARFSLPAELLCIIFACLPLKERIAVTHVCHSWRQIALAARTELWAQIHWDGHRESPGSLTARLKRAGSVLIDLQLTLSKQSFDLDLVVAILGPYMHQLHSLKLTQNHRRLTYEDRVHLRTLLTRDAAPELTSLSVRVRDGLTVERPLFDNVTPKLNLVRLDCVRYLCPSGCHPTVTVLAQHLRRFDVVTHLPPALVPFPALEVLDISSRHYVVAFDPAYDEQKLLFPPQLDALIIECEDGPLDDPDVLEVLPYESLSEVEYIVTADVHRPAPNFPSWHERELFAGCYSPFSAYVKSENDQTDEEYEHDVDGVRLDVTFLDYDSRKRCFSAPHRMLDPSFLEVLGSLAITEYDLYLWYLRSSQNSASVLRMPDLHSLTIYLWDADEHKADRGWRSPFFITPPYGRVIDAPGMMYLELSANDAVTFDPVVITDFTAHFLGVQGPSLLEELGLCNVHLLEDRPSDIAHLVYLFQDIYYQVAPALWEDNIAHWSEEPPIDFS
ncbi:hypothetical protein EXIGLDRAFT_754909 [Exidia glandulosa HHB12029]|uniref:F-box domain-containing protein n=1 Tax=Exidia glandulosa HHB12029 TaxID=1314781 RepID=A0A165CH86_EXIGL|nr:hypothetical protein EXIGLDRAFT_754909 [Exidia glandulosa HHB12029]